MLQGTLTAGTRISLRGEGTINRTVEQGAGKEGSLASQDGLAHKLTLGV